MASKLTLVAAFFDFLKGDANQATKESGHLPCHVKWWYPLWEFLIHVIVGTGILMLIAGAAVLLDFLVHWLTSLGTSSLILWGLKLAEFTLFLRPMFSYFFSSSSEPLCEL